MYLIIAALPCSYQEIIDQDSLGVNPSKMQQEESEGGGGKNKERGSPLAA